MITGQKIALGRIHAGHAVTVHVAEHTITIKLGALPIFRVFACPEPRANETFEI